MSRTPAPYAALLALVEREHALVEAGDWASLEALEPQRRRLVAALPAVPPAAARPALARCLEVQRATTALLAAGVDELRARLGALAHGRTAVRGYGAAPASPRPRLDVAG